MPRGDAYDGIWGDKWIEGIFLYWPLESGEWKGKYVCAAIADVYGVDLHTGDNLWQVPLVTTTNVIWDDSVPPEFPLYDALHKDISTYERIMARVEARQDAQPALPPPAAMQSARPPSMHTLPPMNNFQQGGGSGSRGGSFRDLET